MLSAFNAQPIVELKQRDKSKIESVLAYGDRLLVGLNTGSLRIYRVNESQNDVQKANGNTDQEGRPGSQGKPTPVDLLREVEKFSKRAIEQLAIIKEANLLVSLSDGYVSIHDLQSYTLQEQLTKTKGAVTFAAASNIVKDSITGVPSILSRLAVSVKRRLLLWSWQDSELINDTVEVVLPTPARTLTWSTGTKIICGMNSGYVLVDMETNDIQDIIGPGSIGGSTNQEAGRFGGAGTAGMSYMGMSNWVPKGLATRLSEGELLLAKDINTLFIDSDGNPLERRQIPWAAAPESIGYSYPYLLALQNPAKGALEVRNPDTLSLLQTISLPNATQLHVPQPYISLAHAGKGFLVASDRCIWRMGALQYDAQIDDLVEQGRLDEAISLLGLLEDALLQDKDGRLREVRIRKAQGLFEARKYREALDLFTDASAPPERVIKLYPRIISGSLATENEENQNPEESNPRNTNGHPDARPNTATQIKEGPGSPPNSPRKAKSLAKKTAADNSSIFSFKRDEPSDGSDATSRGRKDSESEKANRVLEGRDLQTAVRELNTFLVGTRTKMQRYLNPDGSLKPNARENSGQGDLSSKAALDSLLLVQTSQEDEDREQKLRETAILVDTTLFRGYMLAQPSLAGPLFRIANFCDPDVVNEKLLERARYNDLVDFFYGKKLHRPALELLKRFGQADKEDEAAPALHGPTRTVAYLQNLSPEYVDLILEFVKWPIKLDADLGMEVFLADTENAETLPRTKVLEFLEHLDLKLAVQYLEHIIDELNDMTPDFHNCLISLYLRRLKQHGRKENQTSLGFESQWEKQKWLDQLLKLLRSSKQYSLSKAFTSIPRDDPQFFEARAIILSNMGQHKQALEIYVYDMEDYEKAESYCNQVYMKEESPASTPAQSRRSSTFDEDESSPSIYHLLLSLYLTPQPPRKATWPPVLALLAKHGSRLPASSTLNLLPLTLPIQELESYFSGRIRAANSIMNEDRIVAGLRKTQVVDAQSTLLLGDGLVSGQSGRNRRVLIEDDRVCGVCHKRLGRSVISVFPDNSVVHYGCSHRVQPGSRNTNAPRRST